MTVGGGIGIANNLITTQDGFVLDARQGKILNEKIEKLKTESPSIAIKEIELNDVVINKKGSGGIYYTAVEGFYQDNNINPDDIIALTIRTYDNASSAFNIYLTQPLDGLGFYSSVLQTIKRVVVRVTYLK